MTNSLGWDLSSPHLHLLLRFAEPAHRSDTGLFGTCKVQIYLDTVTLVDGDDGDHAGDLDLDARAVDQLAGGHQVIEKDPQPLAGVHRQRIDLAPNLCVWPHMSATYSFLEANNMLHACEIPCFRRKRAMERLQSVTSCINVRSGAADLQVIHGLQVK